MSQSALGAAAAGGPAAAGGAAPVGDAALCNATPAGGAAPVGGAAPALSAAPAGDAALGDATPAGGADHSHDASAGSAHLALGEAIWVEAVALDRLRAAGQLSVKLDGRQIAIFLHDGTPQACNNRCPHEGYPLSEGSLDKDCVLTCQWHNWKFDLRSGANLYGGDALRTYPARLLGDQVWVDLAEEPAAMRVERVLGQLDAALAEHALPRISRELARLERAGGSIESAVARAIERGHDRLRYGMTHAHATAEVWLRLRDSLVDPAERLACAAEALGYLGDEVLREQRYPYTTALAAWDRDAFLNAVEAQDEATALACLHGALHAGLGVDALLPALLAAALAHYNDFGHSVIYLAHLRKLAARLGPASVQPLLRAWLRSVIYARREDLLPDFRAYAGALAQWPAAVATSAAAAGPLPDSEAFEARSVRHTLAAVLGAAHHPPEAVLALLMRAGAHHLLRFDEAVVAKTDNPVADNIGWLDFSHALTFAQALREMLPQAPQLWPQGLLQTALFVARNTGYLRADLSSEMALATWRVEDESAFDQRCRAQVLDHGLGVDIFVAHWLKTWMATRDAVAPGASGDAVAPGASGDAVQGLPATTRESMLAAVNRLFAVRFKQRHVLRMARQALAFVARESA